MLFKDKSVGYDLQHKRYVVLLYMLVALIIPFKSIGQQPERENINILFFLVDDLGWADLGFSGSSFYETPNIDALANDGMVFSRAYAAGPNCSPTRASIMTGKYPVRTGITNYIGAPQPGEWKKNTLLLPGAYTEKLSLDEITIAEALKEGGYDTYFAGKWHLGPKGYWPENQGFDVNKGGINLGYPGKGYFSPYNNERLADGPVGEYLPERLTAETIAYLKGRKNQTKPFFVYHSFYLVHSPFMAKKELLAKYEKKREELQLKDEYNSGGKSRQRVNQSDPVYAAMVDALDQAVGAIVKTLKEGGQYDKTLIVFTSDNGGVSTRGNSPTSNLPLRAGKGWGYEGGIREPLIIRWPGVTRAGKESAAPVISVDFYPTLLQIAGLPLKPAQHVDGVSIVPLLEGREMKERKFFWHYPHYANSGSRPFSTVMHGEYKLIRNYEDNSYELYNIVNDIGEANNLVDREPQRVKSMQKLLSSFLQESGANLPVKNSLYKHR